MSQHDPCGAEPVYGLAEVAQGQRDLGLGDVTSRAGDGLLSAEYPPCDPKYAYAVVNKQRVTVEPSSRKVIQVVD